LSKEHANREIGLKIIDFITSNEIPLSNAKIYRAAKPVPEGESIYHVIQDILSQRKSKREYHNGDDQIISTAQSHSKTLGSLLSYQINPSTNPRIVPPVALWAVPSDRNGIEENLTIPSAIQDDEYKVDIKSSYTTTTTTAGTCSSVHPDQFRKGSLLVMLTGIKLFITWPPTRMNLEWLARNDYFGGVHRILDGLDKMEQPTYHILKSGDMTVLPPGQLHAVLSPVNATVGGWTCYKDEWKDYIDMLLRLGKETAIEMET
jgi:hypothetical protein